MPSSTAIDQQIEALEDRAQSLHSIIKLASRAFVVEFAGTPKSGKSTSVEAIRHFFRRHNFGVHVLTERAAQCPIPMKGHLFFNTWCATTMLAELLENVDTQTDLIIVDRGLFDALIWFQTQFKRGELTLVELESIEKFLLMDRWKDLFDMVAVLRAKGCTALKREHSQRITMRQGSIMNTSMLDALCNAVDDAVICYRDEFKKIHIQETDDGDVRSVNADLLDQILSCFESFVNPKILVVPKQDMQNLISTTPSAFRPSSEADRILRIIEDKGQYRSRSEVEEDSSFIQIVPCGVLLHEERVFLFQRHEKNPKSHLYGKSTIWQGCHVRQPAGGNVSEETILKALQTRVAHELFISRQISSGYVGYTWDSTDTGDGKHLGLIFRADIESHDLAQSLQKKNFRRSRGHSLIGDFRKFDELSSNVDEIGLEPWSKSILSNHKALNHE